MSRPDPGRGLEGKRAPAATAGVRFEIAPRKIGTREGAWGMSMNTGQSISAPREAIEHLERAQARWSKIDILLRRLATRLTYAADGRTPALDAMLGELRQLLRLGGSRLTELRFV